MKICTKCKIPKELKEFGKNKNKKDGLNNWCKLCNNITSINYYYNNNQTMLEKCKLRYNKNKEKISKQNKEYHQKYPWKQTFTSIKQRCNNPKNLRYKDYGKRGIKCLITSEEIKELWFRDKAYLMESPSIDRIDNNGNYCIENCRFIEMDVNRVKDRYKPILQYDLNENFIKEWESAVEANKFLGFNKSHISCCAKGKRKTAMGFIWRYKSC